ncbi:MAG TPA: hypothetical protein VMZ03_09585 [Chitinophagaceae bacterium]|nr:hypothetical protein [Chitinophagaceae bacterium]
MRKLKYIFTLLVIPGLPALVQAQEGNKESAVGEFMRSTERSYVVIAVILTILIGLFLYLVRLEKKISRLEKDNGQ